MTSTLPWPAKRLLAAGLLVALMAAPSYGGIIRSADTAQARQDLFLLGFGELTMHMLDINGNVQAFEAANPTMKNDFFTDYRLSMFANGHASRKLMLNGVAILDSRIDDEYYTIDPTEFRLRMSAESTEPLWDGWRFTGHTVYDPARQWEVANLDTRLLTQPQEPSRLELLARLESDDHGYVEGGSIRPTFKNAAFTLHQRSVFGVYADLYDEKVGAEAVAGKLEGKKFRQGEVNGIRADGTSGPYDLDYAPITRGSDEIKVEVRDRYNETTVLSSRTLVRDIDYTIDYVRGRVLLHRPEASETTAGDPVYIVITYDYYREDSDDIYGGRAHAMPSDKATVSGTYLHRHIDDRTTGAGIDEPEDLYAADASIKVADHTTAYVEVAGAENPDSTTDDSHTALRFGAATEVVKNLKLNADVLRIDDQFRSFTNSDLDANKNQQRINVGGSYQLDNKQSATASFTDIRGLEANGDYNTYDGRRNEKIMAAGYRNSMKDQFGFGLRFERRNVKDLDNTLHENNNRSRAIVDLDGRFAEVSVLGEVGYKVNYELDVFRNELESTTLHDANTNQMAVSFSSRPVERASIEVVHRVSVRKDKELDLYDDRKDASFATLQWRLHDNVNTLTTYEYKRYTVPGGSLSLWQDDPVKTERSGTFAVEYLPIEQIKALTKLGRYDARSWYSLIPKRDCHDFFMAQATYFHTHHLSFGAETEYDWNLADSAGVHSFFHTWDLGLKVNWNRDRLNEFTVGMIRRWQQDESAESQTYILLASGSLSLTRTLFARGSIKETLLNEPLDDEKMFTRLELGYDSHDWYRVSLGYERISSDPEDDPDNEYTANGVFVRLSGKM